MTCTFFGHRNAPDAIKGDLRTALVDLIENKNVNKIIGGANEFKALAEKKNKTVINLAK